MQARGGRGWGGESCDGEEGFFSPLLERVWGQSKRVFFSSLCVKGWSGERGDFFVGEGVRRGKTRSFFVVGERGCREG